jgi:hypothetical protein
VITKIENASFIADAFGPMPVWSIKQDEENWFLFVIDDKPLNPKIARIHDFFKKINEIFSRDDVYITGEIDWEKDTESDYKVIKDMAVKRVFIIPDGLMEIGQPGSRNISELEVK